MSLSEENKLNLFIFGFFALFIALVLGFLLWFESTKCENRSISFEDHSFKIIGGCMVKHNGRWLPLENIRGFSDE